MKYLKLIYYYSNDCSACKEYQSVINKVSDELRIDVDAINIDTGRLRHLLAGIPTVIIENNGRDVYKSVGNLPFNDLIRDIKEKVYDK